MLLLVPFGNNVRGMWINPDRIEPRTASVPGPNRQNSPYEARIIGEEMLGSYTSQRTWTNK